MGLDCKAFLTASLVLESTLKAGFVEILSAKNVSFENSLLPTQTPNRLKNKEESKKIEVFR
jgi:hypothetical protein